MKEDGFMRYLKKDISHIQFTYTSYTEELKNSILRIGFSFPIHVILKENNIYVLMVINVYLYLKIF